MPHVVNSILRSKGMRRACGVAEQPVPDNDEQSRRANGTDPNLCVNLQNKGDN